MIVFHENKKLFHLSTRNMSYIFGVGGYLQNLYWGEPVNAEDCAELMEVNFHSSFDPDTNLDREEFTCWNGRSFAEPCLKLQQGGESVVFTEFAGWEIFNGQEGVQTLRITLEDKIREFQLILEYVVYEELDIISRKAILNNIGGPLMIENFQSAALSLPQLERPFIRYVTGKWAGEFVINDAPVNTGVFTMQSKRGMTGPHFNPSFAVYEEGATEQNGNVWFGQLAYSGNWKISVEKTIFDNIRVTGGMNDSDFFKTLGQGESLETPEFFFGFSNGGFGGMSRKLHRFQKAHITTASKPRRVLYNSWEATAFDVNVKEQMKLADKAASMGVELFVVDDGWFGERHGDNAGLGDWTPNAGKFPNGLGELISYVNGLGMDFGIWVEPEAVNPDSCLFRAHPDWIYHIDGVEPMQSRNQYVLNISLKEVREYLLGMLRSLLVQNNISFLKWDMNRMITDLGSRDGVDHRELWRAHVDALYEIWDTLRSEFPQVELETCAGGGGRIDPGILKYADQSWPSDNTDPYERLFIQEGFTNFYNPGIMMCWVTDTHPSYRRSGRRDISYKFRSAMCGGLGIGSNIGNLTAEELSLYSSHIDEYKSIRHIVQNGRLYRLLLPGNSPVSAVQYISESDEESVVFAFLHSQKFGDPCKRLKLQGLSKNSRYLVRTAGSEESDRVYYGSTLMHIGLPLSLKGDFDSALLKIKKLGE